MQCLIYCIAEKISIPQLETALRSQSYKIIKRHDVIEWYISNESICYFFNNGTFVSWNINKRAIQPYLDIAVQCCHNPITQPHIDRYLYVIGDQLAIEPHDYFNVEILTIDEDESDVKLALSYGFSRSIKLKYYEHILKNLVDKYSPITNKIAHGVRKPISRKSILKVIGNILEVKSMINLKSDFSFQPAFIWQHPNVEDYYLLIERYLDIPQRVSFLNTKLDTMSEVYNMLNSYLETKHSHFLEIIIIVLLITEIIFSLLHLQL